MQVTFAEQYNINCVVAETGDTAQEVIDFCRDIEAVRHVDGLEFCAQLRDDVGPELWTEDALRGSLPSS